MLHISLLTLVLLASINEGAIISQSAISDCSWGDTSEPTSSSGEVCSKKMLISMVLGSGQGNTESLQANVDKAYEQGNTEMSVLKKPFRIELRKTAVVASYRARVIGTANALPKETTIAKKNCNDDFHTRNDKLPCGMQYDKRGAKVWDSQGFCCRCDSINKHHNVRGGQVCGLAFFQGKGSAHCMKMDDLWYDVFELEMPMMQYRITLDVFEFQGINVNETDGGKSVNWTLVSTFHLSPSRTVGRSKSGRVIAEVQGSLLGSKAIKDLSAKRLLIPSVRMWPKNKPYPTPYTNGPSDWMLVDSHMVMLSGTECNKIGVYYTGFRRQPGRCEIKQGLCFNNQPLQFWYHDNEQRKKKKAGRFMIHNFGKVHHGSHPNKHSFILKFLHDDLHNSFVTLRIDASDITFVKSVSSGRIVEIYTTDFEATSTFGTLTVEIANTGEISSEFSVSVVKCTTGLFTIPAKTVTLEPAEVKNITYKLRSTEKEGGNKECEVQLFDSTYTLLQTSKVRFKVDTACFCFGQCGCTCDNDKNEFKCATESGPPTLYKTGPIVTTLLMMVLESIGAHGFIAFFGGLLLILGFIKLSCGGILCCRKTKQQEHTQRLLEKGVPPKSPLLVQCSGECRGAKAAKARYTRKVQRLKQAGKSPHRLDDWRNTSFECQCKSELTDVRFVHVVRAVCFFYFCCFLPFIWIGRCVVWRIFKDTEEKKAKAEKEVLLKAKKKGNMEKYGVIDLATELKQFEDDTEGKPSMSTDDGPSAASQALLMNIDYTSVMKNKIELEKVTKHKKDKPKKHQLKKNKQPKMRGQKQQVQCHMVGGGFEHRFYGQSASPQLRAEKGTQEKLHRLESGPRREKRKKGEACEREKGRRKEQSGRKRREGTCKSKGKSIKKSGHGKSSGKSHSSVSSKPDGHSSRADISHSGSEHTHSQASHASAKSDGSKHTHPLSSQASHASAKSDGSKHTHPLSSQASHASAKSDGSKHTHPLSSQASHASVKSDGSKHTHPLSSQASHASIEIEDSKHSGEESCKSQENVDKASLTSGHSLHSHSGSEVASIHSCNASEHSNSHSVSRHSSASHSNHSTSHTSTHSASHSSHSVFHGNQDSVSSHSSHHSSHASHSVSHASSHSASHSSHSLFHRNQDSVSSHSSHHSSKSSHSGSQSCKSSNDSSHSNESGSSSHSNSRASANEDSHSDSGGSSDEDSHSDSESDEDSHNSSSSEGSDEIDNESESSSESDESSESSESESESSSESVSPSAEASNHDNASGSQ